MVYRQIDKGTTIRRRKTRFVLSVIFLMLVLIITGGTLGYFIGESKNNTTEPPKITLDSSSEKQEHPDEPEIEFIDFQPIVNEWAESTRGNKSVIIYDADNNDVAASYNPDMSYNTASLYKLFVVYEGYKRINNGDWTENQYLNSAKHTIIECLDLAIRESNSACAEALWSKIGRSELDRILRDDFAIESTNIEKLISTPEDIAKIMRLYYDHPNITDDNLVNLIKDSFLNQPITTYDWRQGLPSGFSRARVYNKVGWEYNPDKKYWNVYHDAAIIEFPDEKRHFIVVVMTNYVPFEKIRDLGAAIENYYYKNI